MIATDRNSARETRRDAGPLVSARIEPRTRAAARKRKPFPTMGGMDSTRTAMPR